jgi:beta-glucosidase
LTDTLLRIAERYGHIPIYITECGAAFTDPPSEDGADVQDPERVEFLRSHIKAAWRAREKGVDLRGFFVWSLLDNFEWASGYTMPFGLVQVDFDTQRRTMKSSARFYAEVIESSGENVLREAGVGDRALAGATTRAIPGSLAPDV